MSKASRKPYEEPAVVLEVMLEVRAGSCIILPDAVNPLGKATKKLQKLGEGTVE